MHRSQRWAAGLLATSLAVSACAAGSTEDASRLRRRVSPAQPAGLRAFDACGPLLDELRDVGVDQVNTFGLGPDVVSDFGVAAGAERAPATTLAGPLQPSREPSGADWGGTNTQEVGVDEPDTVKTDGALLLAVADDTLRIVDLSADEPQIIGQHRVMYGSQLLVDGDRVLVLAPAADGISTALSTIDIGTPSEPSIEQEIRLDGALVSARMVDGTARVVTTTGTPPLDFVPPSSTRATESARRRNLAVVRDSDIDDWLPGFRTTDARGRTIASGPMVDCADVYLPEQAASAAMVSVVSLDLRSDAPRPVDGASVVGAGENVYASAAGLYVTSTAFDGESFQSGRFTDVHKFSIAGREPATYVASGRVAGSVLNQFSMSEQNGYLRLAVTTDGVSVGGAAPLTTTTLADRPIGPGPEAVPPPMPTTQSSVLVLREQSGELVQVGRVEGLGRGEQIRSVRFIGDVGYVVTFRQTDPLYTVDLSDPATPRMVGELKIPGYSSYLHPAGDGLLIGIGQDATTQGALLGLQIALYDVSDPAAPRQIQKRVLEGANSSAESDHHAFLWWADEGLAVLPVNGQAGTGFSVSPNGIDERGRVLHAGAAVERFVVVDGELVALSSAGLSVTDPASFDQLAWLAFN